MPLDRSRRKSILKKLAGKAGKSLSNAPSGTIKAETSSKRIAQPGHSKNLSSDQVKRILKRKRPSKNEYPTPGMA